jgi:hypothetical protein
MFRTVIAGGLLAALVGGARAEDRRQPSDRPKGPPPAQVVVSVEKNDLLVPFVAQELRRERRTRTVNRDGQDRQEQYTVVVPHWREDVKRIDLRDVQASTADGRAVRSQKLADMLQRPTHVLISGDGHKVDPFYLEIIKPQTLVLILPTPKEAPDERLPRPGEPQQPRGDRPPAGREAPPRVNDRPPAGREAAPPDRRPPQP